MRRLFLTLPFAIAAGPLVADIIEQPGAEGMVCSYVEECYETEECTFAKFEHDVVLPKRMPGEAKLLLGTGEAVGEARIVNKALVVTASDSAASYMMSNNSDGFAKLSIHFAQELTVVTYHGTCTIDQ